MQPIKSADWEHQSVYVPEYVSDFMFFLLGCVYKSDRTDVEHANYGKDNN